VVERCALIHAEKDNYDVTFMCRLMHVPRSTYYAWTHRAETPTRARRRALALEVTKEFNNSRQTSGCRRIAAALNRRGIACSVGLVADLMRELGLAAVQPAIDAGHVAPDAIFHSDRGTQYTSAEFAAFTAKNGIRRSLGRTGVCWDNAVAESFFAALKNEMYYRQSFATRARARFAVAEYIEV